MGSSPAEWQINHMVVGSIPQEFNRHQQRQTII